MWGFGPSADGERADCNILADPVKCREGLVVAGPLLVGLLFIPKTAFPVAEHGTCFVTAVFGCAPGHIQAGDPNAVAAMWLGILPAFILARFAVRRSAIPVSF